MVLLQFGSSSLGFLVFFGFLSGFAMIWPQALWAGGPEKEISLFIVSLFIIRFCCALGSLLSPGHKDAVKKEKGRKTTTKTKNRRPPCGKPPRLRDIYIYIYVYICTYT